MSFEGFVDAHAHVFPEVRGRIAEGPTVGEDLGMVRAGARSFPAFPPIAGKAAHTPEMLLKQMDSANVARAMLLQGPFYGEWNAYVQAAVRAHPKRFACAAFIDPWGDGFGPSQVSDVLDSGSFRAVKLECSEETGLFGLHPEASLADARVRWLWAELERLGTVLVLDLGPITSRPYDSEAVGVIAKEHPDLKIVICHLGHPTPRLNSDKEQLRRWEEQVSLARMPNVWLDAASLPALFNPEPFPYQGARVWFERALHIVGHRKIMWGTDAPGLLLHCTYVQLIQLGQVLTGALSRGERESVLGGNAEEIYFD